MMVNASIWSIKPFSAMGRMPHRIAVSKDKASPKRQRPLGVCILLFEVSTHLSLGKCSAWITKNPSLKKLISHAMAF